MSKLAFKDDKDGYYECSVSEGEAAPEWAARLTPCDVLLSVPNTPVTPAVSPRQIRQALTRAGLRESVEAAVAAADQDTKDWWEFSTSFERLNPVAVAMAQALGVSDAQTDALWLLAGSL